MEPFWRGKRVFVTGATGLVGSWLTKALIKEGAYVVALMRDFDPQSELIRSGLVQKISLVQGALEDFASLERAINDQEIDTVFHLGAQTLVGSALRQPLATFESNIRGTYHLLEACRRQKELVSRIVVASSDKAYGASEILPYTEEMPLCGKHPYDVSKSCADLLCHTYHHTYHLPVVMARCGNIYGGGDLHWSRLIPGTIRSLHRQEVPHIRSDGTLTRDYIYVEDVVGAYLLLAQQASCEEIQGQAFNFGSAQPFSVLEIVAIIQKLMGLPDLVPKIHDAVAAEIKHQSLNSLKAQQALSWQVRWPLEEGLQETIKWYAHYFEQVCCV